MFILFNFEEVLSTLMFWVQQGLDLTLAQSHPNLPIKVRHLKAGIKLTQSLIICGPPLIDGLLQLEFSSGENNHTVSFIHKLLDFLVTPYMNMYTKLLIIRTLDNLLVFKKG